MRHLTVKRGKSYVGCLAKVKIYIADAQSGSLTIMGTPCRLLGELKNGEEKTFSIGPEATVVYAIADKLSKDYCNDSFQIPAGQEDITVSGKCGFTLGSNAFSFDGQDTPQKQQLRKKNGRKGLLITIICCILGVIVGRFIGNGVASAMLSAPPEEKIFSADAMRITLTEDFEVFENQRFTSVLVSPEVGITILKEPFHLVPGSEGLSLEEYGHLVITNNDITGTMLCTKNGLTFFEFTRENAETGQVFAYFAAVYKSVDAFWLVQMGVPDEDYTQWRETLEVYARSVIFE